MSAPSRSQIYTLCALVALALSAACVTRLQSAGNDTIAPVTSTSVDATLPLHGGR